MTALDDGLFRFFLTDTISQSEFVKWDLRHEVIQRAIVDLFSFRGYIVFENLRISLLRVSKILHQTESKKCIKF